MNKIENRIGADSITLQLDGRDSGISKSTLHIAEADEDYAADYRVTYNSAIDGLESHLERRIKRLRERLKIFDRNAVIALDDGDDTLTGSPT